MQGSAGHLDQTVGASWRLGRKIINDGMGSKILGTMRSPGKNLPKKKGEGNMGSFCSRGEGKAQ